MPSFEVKFVDPIIEILRDPQRDPGTDGSDDKGAPSRLNPSGTREMYHARVEPGQQVNLICRVDGVDGPSDGTLGGLLFDYAFAEWTGQQNYAPPAVTKTPGFSSIASFTAEHPGHYTLVVYRGWGDGGRVFVHISSEEP